jgi:hypothetical protein
MVLQQKIEMLDSLLEIEIAYTMLKAKSEGDKSVHPLDTHYAKLNTHIEVLDRDTDEFELLRQYVMNTHARTHTQYYLEILEVSLEEHITSIFRLKVLYLQCVPLLPSVQNIVMQGCLNVEMRVVGFLCGVVV